MLAVFVQFIASTAGIALLVAIFKGVSFLSSDRGPRKRVEAIKVAQETLGALGDGPAAEAVRDQRDREVEALRRSAQRRAATRARWLRITKPFRNHPAITVVSLAVAVVVSLGLALLLPTLSKYTSFFSDSSAWAFVLSSVASLAVSAAVLGLAWLNARREDDEEDLRDRVYALQVRLKAKARGDAGEQDRPTG